MHFIKRRNIYERARSDNRWKEQGESVDTFITALYSLAEHCGFGMLHDEMIQDRIVIGIWDAKLSEKLQLGAELALSKAVTQVRQAEAVKLQQPLVSLRGETHESAVLDYGDIFWVPNCVTEAVVGEKVASRSYELVTGRGTATCKKQTWFNEDARKWSGNCSTRELSITRKGNFARYRCSMQEQPRVPSSDSLQSELGITTTSKGRCGVTLNDLILIINYYSY